MRLLQNEKNITKRSESLGALWQITKSNAEKSLRRKASTICDGIRDLQERRWIVARMQPLRRCKDSDGAKTDAETPTEKRPDHAGFGSQQQDFGRD
jgi:hypothetical protein